MWYELEKKCLTLQNDGGILIKLSRETVSKTSIKYQILRCIRFVITRL